MANVSSSNGLEKCPKLRFPGFDKPWNESKLSACFAKNIKKNTDGRISNVICNSAKMGLIPQRDYFDKDIANSDNTSGYYIIEHNDFVYNPRKSSDAPYGPISRYAYPDAGIVSPLYLCFRAKGEVDTNFFEWYFHSSAWHRYIYMSGDSGARHDRVSIKDDDFFSMPICFPSSIEQKKIASFLNTIERRISSQQLLVDNLKKYKRGLQNRFFFKRSHLSPKASEIDSHDVEPLGSVVHINPKTGSIPEAFIYIDLECVESGVLNSKKLISRNSAPSRAQRLLEEGDLLYQMVRPYQKNNYYFRKAFEYPTVASTGYAQIRCSKVDIQFIYEQLSSDYFAREAMLRSTGTGYPAINADDLAEIPVWVPPLVQQEKIGAALSFLGEKIEVHQKLLSALCSVKSSLLQQLFI